jgi:LPXTG-motif cell wall-anchored protein
MGPITNQKGDPMAEVLGIIIGVSAIAAIASFFYVKKKRKTNPEWKPEWPWLNWL